MTRDVRLMLLAAAIEQRDAMETAHTAISEYSKATDNKYLAVAVLYEKVVENFNLIVKELGG